MIPANFGGSYDDHSNPAAHGLGPGDSPTISDGGRASDHLANERTFLAWIRTSISIVVFGFVVAKFGITLRQLLRLQEQTSQSSTASLAIGLGFMAVGVFIALVAMFRYRLVLRSLEAGQFTPARGIIVFVGTVSALFGLVLAIYLVLTAQSFP
jgi:putative membrane protein